MKGERATGSKEDTVMAKIGRVVTNPSGRYCNITIHSREKTIASVAYAQGCA